MEEQRSNCCNDNNSGQQGAPRPVRHSSNGDRRELWCLAHAMTVAAAVALWHRAHLYKAIACVVLALIAIQYLLSGVIDRRSIETIFTINATRYVAHSSRDDYFFFCYSFRSRWVEKLSMIDRLINEIIGTIKTLDLSFWAVEIKVDDDYSEN